MNIAIIVTIVSGFGQKGFYHSQEIGLAKELEKSGNNVQVYKCVSTKLIKEERNENYGSIKIKYIPTYSLGPHGWISTSVLDEKIDVMFAFSDTQLIVPKLYKFCKKNDILFIPYVGIAHSFKNNFTSKIIDFIFKLTTLQVYKKTTVFTKTETAKKELESYGVKKCIVNPVGLDIDLLKLDFENFDRNELRKKWEYNSNDEIILFVGRLEPEKRPMEMLDIFSKVVDNNKKLLIVGDGSLTTSVMNQIEKSDYLDRVKVITKIPYEEMWEIHYIADWFVNVRPDEIFGMAVMEAVFYKSAVVARAAAGPSTILNGLLGHKICETDEEISDYINCNRIDVEGISESSKQLINKYTWNRCARNIVDLVKQQ